ncbi:MAG TPA: DUF4375 domain-containing protein [Humisphaera sp.]
MLNDYEKAYYAVAWLGIEAQNGGLNQFFFNSTGGMVPEVRMGLRMMGAERTLSILERAMRLFGRQELPRDDLERREIVLSLAEEAEESLDELTDEFFDVVDELHEQHTSFATRNRQRFGAA